MRKDDEQLATGNRTAEEDATAEAGTVSREQLEAFWSTEYRDAYERMVGTLVFWLRHSFITYDDDGTHNLLAMLLEDRPDLAGKLAKWLPYVGSET